MSRKTTDKSSERSSKGGSEKVLGKRKFESKTPAVEQSHSMTGAVAKKKKVGLDVGEYLANGSYGLITKKGPHVFKILMNFTNHDKEKKDKNKKKFKREISITKFLSEEEEKSKNPDFPNPFVAIKNEYEDVEIDLGKFKAKLDTDQQENFDTKSPVYMYEMDNAGIPLLDFLESQHKLKCRCGDKLKCDIYTGLEIEFILKLAELLDYLQKKYKFVHGDLSYNNVMVSVTDQGYHLVLIDIGNAYACVKKDEHDVEVDEHDDVEVDEHDVEVDEYDVEVDEHDVEVDEKKKKKKEMRWKRIYLRNVLLWRKTL